jgi:hypothetical protein
MTTLVLNKTEAKSRLVQALLRGAQKSRPLLVKTHGQRVQVNAKLAYAALRSRKKSLSAPPLEPDEIALMNSAPLVNTSGIE